MNALLSPLAASRHLASHAPAAAEIANDGREMSASAPLDWLLLIERIGVRQPSGASVAPIGGRFLKVARGNAAERLRRQAEWLGASRRLGYAHCPEVLFPIEGGQSFFGYAMPRYEPLDLARWDRVVLAERVLRALQSLWHLPAVSLPPLAIEPYVARVCGILAPYDAGAAAELARLAARLRWGRLAVTCVHGDPTFENLALDARGEIVLLDPNPQSAPAICIPELDIAKILGSLAGWEDFVKGGTEVLLPNDGLCRTICALAGEAAWPLAVWLATSHFVRTMPYGAKRGDAALILPTIRLWLEYCSRLV